MKAPITTHVLYLHTGEPAAGLEVTLMPPEGDWRAHGETDADGRIQVWSRDIALAPGRWQLSFATEAWFGRRGEPAFFADVQIAFNADAARPHYHVPLLLNAFGFSTYRGS